MKRDGSNESLWQATTAAENFNQQDNNTIYDVLIIGGGITGLTTALELQSAGKKCILAEAANIGFGTTGGTTAHINTFFDAPYDQVISDFGEENAKLFSQAGYDAIAIIQKNIASHAIECGFEQRTGYVFSVEENQNKDLENMVEASQKLGIKMDFINDNPFPIPYIRIASVEDQAQFHPGAYITGLAKAFVQSGGIIMEQCRVTGIEEEEILTAETTSGKIKARNAFYATHIPPGVNILHFRNAPYRSYAIAVTLKDGKYPQALGYDMCDPYHYYRSQKADGKEYLIAGGEDHKTGHEENTEQCFRRLESYVRKYFDVDEVAYKWSSQYFIPADGLPYIGHLPGNRENIYCATGFNGNGITLGTLSGAIIADLIIKGENKYKKLFSPARVKPVAGFTNFVKESADVVAKFIGDRIGAAKIDGLNELAAGEAKVVKHDGHVLAVYKDENNQVHCVNSACTHIKCTVGWNNSEKTWDCPCHGSRFSVDGVMLTAPARKDLEQIQWEENE